MEYIRIEEAGGCDSATHEGGLVLQFNLIRVEIHELRPKVVTEDKGVLVHYCSRTNVWRRLSSKTLA